MASEIKSCSCENANQDKLHGKGLRVWNSTTKGYRCTACGTEKTSSAPVKASKK